LTLSNENDMKHPHTSYTAIRYYTKNKCGRSEEPCAQILSLKHYKWPFILL
jgi:hypothetical protein